MKVPILMYHSISLACTPKFRTFAVSPALFAEQMAYLYQHGYTPITVTHLVNSRSSAWATLPERPVVVTFDDGFADFFTDALPALKRYNFVATLYITTAFVGGTSSWLWREKEATRPMLTWDQIAEINAQGIECGGHSHTHPQLDLLPLSAARREVVQSKEVLEHHLGQTVSSFAYPYGYHSVTLQRIVKEAGYTSACAVKYEMSVETTNPFSLARLLVNGNTDRDTLAALLASPPPHLATALYKRARIPMWRFIRRYSNSMTPHSVLGNPSTVVKE